MRVLFIDDDRINALLFEETCRLAGGIEVATAGSGAEAHLAVAEARPDVLVIDLHLPDIRGDALLAALRAGGLTGVPAYLCTADDPRDVELLAREAGFQGCWTKPVALDRLLADLARLRS